MLLLLLCIFYCIIKSQNKTVRTNTDEKLHGRHRITIKLVIIMFEVKIIRTVNKFRSKYDYSLHFKIQYVL